MTIVHTRPDPAVREDITGEEMKDSATAYMFPARREGAIYFSLALQDGTRQPWRIKDTISNWQFAVWVWVHDRPIEERA